MRRQTAESAEFLSRCVSIDLEVDPNGDRIKSFAAIRPGKARPFIYNRGSLARALDELDDYADGAEFLLGHNIMFFDARHLAAKRSDLRILSKKVIDTLWLNPLAFPRHPYHRLVKHYLDGRLQAERVSEPLYDAELVFDVLKNQIDSFRSLDQQRPELLAALHWLAANDRNGPGFDSVFALAREAPRPNAPAAQDAVRDLLRERACTLRTESAISDAERNGWPLAYALSWVMVAGENSVMPPWVRHQFPRAGELVRELRDTPCSDPACKWCRS
ncbi:MAG: RecQ family ATP-dependent DNA helicase, partial [Boseongicola sp.]|nr:RecQ family ATP-dependent DNA helicase [Boseongicola sp.]